MSNSFAGYPESMRRAAGYTLVVQDVDEETPASSPSTEKQPLSCSLGYPVPVLVLKNRTAVEKNLPQCNDMV